MGLVWATGVSLLILPLFVAMRSYAEGWAALRKKPVPVIAGQAVYLAAVATVSFFALNSGLGGNLIGAVSLCAGNILSMAVIYLSMDVEMKNSQMPIEKESASQYPEADA